MLQIGVLLCLSLGLTFLVAYLTHCMIYPRVSGVVPLSTHEVAYKVGRVPFVNAGKLFINLFQHWWVVRDMKDFARCYQSFKIETKSYWAHIVDCGLLYPSIAIYVWVGLDYALFK